MSRDLRANSLILLISFQLSHYAENSTKTISWANSRSTRPAQHCTVVVTACVPGRHSARRAHRAMRGAAGVRQRSIRLPRLSTPLTSRACRAEDDPNAIELAKVLLSPSQVGPYLLKNHRRQWRLPGEHSQTRATASACPLDCRPQQDGDRSAAALIRGRNGCTACAEHHCAPRRIPALHRPKLMRATTNPPMVSAS